MWLLPYLPQPSPQEALQDSQRRGTAVLLTIHLKDIAATCLSDVVRGKRYFQRRLGTLVF